MRNNYYLTKIFVATFKPIIFHFAVKLFHIFSFLFSCAFFVSLIFELRIPKGSTAAAFDVLSEFEPVENLTTTALLGFVRLTLVGLATLLECNLVSERPSQNLDGQSDNYLLVLSSF